MLTPHRLDAILTALRGLRVAVVGDFYLDRYLEIDPSREERSLETGLPAHQVSAVRVSAGGAGNVAANVAALGVAHVETFGIVGDDGAGVELSRTLRRFGIGTGGLIPGEERLTPTYTKPMLGGRELERLDIRDRAPMPAGLTERLVAFLEEWIPLVDAVLIVDQVEEPEWGVVGTAMRGLLCGAAQRNPHIHFLATSRARVGAFHPMAIQANGREALRAVHGEDRAPTSEEAAQAGQALALRARRTAFITLGSEGILVCGADGCHSVPACAVDGPVDPVGAGDTAAAAILCALATGADADEAAEMGALAAAVTVRKIGTTGTASPEEVRGMLRRRG